MKKILITSALAVLLVAGYIVGQVQFSEPTSNPRPTHTGVGKGDGIMPLSENSVDSPLIGAPVQKNSIEIASTDVVVECEVGDCSTPSVGDPKGTKIIKSGTVKITIKRGSLNENYDNVVTLIGDGGYVESSSSSRRVSTLTVRIPAEKLDATLKALRKIGTITDESVSSYDRSFDAVDYDARLKIMREREAVLNDQLKKAAASDTAYIQEQLFNLHTQIESLEGQKKLLDSQVAMSTLSVTLTEKGVKTDDPGEKTMLGKAWTTAVDSLLTTVGGIVIVVAALLPFLVLGALIVIITRTVLKKKKINKED